MTLFDFYKFLNKNIAFYHYNTLLLQIKKFISYGY